MRRAYVTTFEQNFPPQLYMWAGGVALLAILCAILAHGQFHLLLAILILLGLLSLSTVNKQLTIVLTFTYMFLMGDLRRLVSTIAPQPSFDPLLIVGPAMAFYLALPFLYQVTLKDRLSKAMLALLVMMTLEIANPIQGGLAVGLSGAFFYIVPVLWFWIGRGLASTVVLENLFYKSILPLAGCAAILGICQTFIGFLPFEQTWINSATRVYTSLYIGSSIRAFGFSVNAAEYATLLAFGALTIAGAFFAGRRIWILLLPLLGTALVLESSRGFIVKSVFALSVVWVMRKGARVRASTLIGMVAVGVLSLASLSFVASRLTPATDSAPQRGSSAQEAVSHQLGGLGHPFDSRYSTAGTHASMISTSLLRGVTHPLGFGLGYTTFAAEKLSGQGQTDQGSSEMDLTDMFTALGLVGGIIYLSVAFLVLQGAVRYVRVAPLHISLPVLAITFESFGGWLVGGQYSSSSMLFFLFGALIYRENRT